MTSGEPWGWVKTLIGRPFHVGYSVESTGKLMLGGPGQRVRPRRGAARPTQLPGALGSRILAGGEVDATAQPAMMSGVVVPGGARLGQRWRLEFMPAGDAWPNCSGRASAGASPDRRLMAANGKMLA